MPSRDPEMRNYTRRKNYQQTAGFPPRPWTLSEIKIILAQDVTDRELSRRLNRSVQSIQVMRCRAKKQGD